MGSSHSTPISAPLLAALQEAADVNGFIPFDVFMEIALYHPAAGYYCREKPRVGLDQRADFFTASSLGPVFGELIIAACLHRLGDRNPADTKFVEFGAENGQSVLDGIDHPFAGLVTVQVGQKYELNGSCIVFSNELFDAQPCRRFVRRGDSWREIGVEIIENNPQEAERDAINPPDVLPPESPEGYHLDLPEKAAALAAEIGSHSWDGLFLAFDYGKSWREMSEATPQGTVRAYHNHQQSNDLLARVGEQDLTCHVCWDWIGESLQKHHFSIDPVASQEAFLVKNAAKTLARIMQEEAKHMSTRKSGLLQLLHPSALGQKFQVFSAWRDDS